MQPLAAVNVATLCCCCCYHVHLRTRLRQTFNSNTVCEAAANLSVNYPVFVSTPPPIEERSIVMSVSVSLFVCVCVCVRNHIYTSDLHHISAHVAHGRGSVLLWRSSDTLCTSGSMDDVIFAHKPRLLDVAAQLKRNAHAALGLAINCAQ